MQQEPHYYRLVYRKSKIYESFVLIIKYNRWALKPPETLASSQSEATSPQCEGLTARGALCAPEFRLHASCILF